MNKTYHLVYSLLLLSLIGQSANAGDVVLPEGWRYPTIEELSTPIRKDSPAKYAKVAADFNRDGIVDQAFLLKNTKCSGEGLLVRLSDKKAGFSWITLDTIDWGENYHKVNLSMCIEVVKPGEYKTACAKGYWKCKKDEPLIVKVTTAAIDYFQPESANSFFIWDAKTTRFIRIWISD